MGGLIVLRSSSPALAVTHVPLPHSSFFSNLKFIFAYIHINSYFYSYSLVIKTVGSCSI